MSAGSNSAESTGVIRDASLTTCQASRAPSQHCQDGTAACFGPYVPGMRTMSPTTTTLRAPVDIRPTLLRLMAAVKTSGARLATSHTRCSQARWTAGDVPEAKQLPAELLAIRNVVCTG